jgi:hypothetical protein
MEEGNMKMTTSVQRLLIGLGTVCGFLVPAAALAGGDEAHKGDRKGGLAEMSNMDSDGDGKLSADEHAAAARTMFEAMDTDKDGKVSAAEMEAAQSQMMGRMSDKDAKAYKQTRMSAADKIAKVDTNGDGALSADEQAAGARTMFERMDTNKDGYLTKAELKSGHDKLMRKGAADKTTPAKPSGPAGD